MTAASEKGGGRSGWPADPIVVRVYKVFVGAGIRYQIWTFVEVKYILLRCGNGALYAERNVGGFALVC